MQILVLNNNIHKAYIIISPNICLFVGDHGNPCSSHRVPRRARRASSGTLLPEPT